MMPRPAPTLVPILVVAGFFTVVGTPLYFGCSTSSPASAAPLCDGGVLQAGFCVVSEVSETADAGPGISLSRDIQPVFNHYCVVVGCHVSGNPVGALNLAPGFSYDQLVDATPGELNQLPNGDPLVYVAAGDKDHSYLYYKIHPEVFAALKDAAPEATLGTEMPAKATGSFFSQDPDAQAAIDNWIQGGALP